MGRTMLTALQAHPAFSVTGAYDPVQPVPAGVQAYASAEVLAASPDITLIYVASPPRHHLAGIMLAAAAGKPVLCEKPLAPSVEEARHCLALIERSGIQAAVNFYFAASDAALRLRRLVRSGAIGNIERARLTLRFREWPRPWQKAAGSWLALPEEGGFTREVASHFLFLMLRMFGPGSIEESRTQRSVAGTEASLKARIRYDSLTLEIDAALEGERDDHNRLLIQGSKGEASIVDWDRLDYGGSAGDPLPESFMLDSLAAMLDGKPHELATMAEAVQVVALTERLLGVAG